MTNPCDGCGACCEACNFYGVDPVDLAHVPEAVRGPGEDRHNPDSLGMFTVARPDGDGSKGRRCGVLTGTVGADARCGLYATATEPDRRPWVCAGVPAGSWLCTIARDRAGLPVLDAAPWPPPGWAMRLGWPPCQFQRFGTVFRGDSDVWAAWMGWLVESLEERWIGLAALYRSAA